MDIKKVNVLGNELENWLKMRVHPVAVKMLENENEIPKEAVIPTRDWKHKYAFCQTIARSQRHGDTIAMFKEDHWCFEPVVGLGLVEFPNSFANGSHRYPDSVRNLEAASRWGKNMPRFPFGKYQGVVTAPVNSCHFMPDILVMHINGLMATMLMIIKNWIDGAYSGVSGRQFRRHPDIKPEHPDTLSIHFLLTLFLINNYHLVQIKLIT